jgi:hypothetical protein
MVRHQINRCSRSSALACTTSNLVSTYICSTHCFAYAQTISLEAVRQPGPQNCLAT